MTDGQIEVEREEIEHGGRYVVYLAEGAEAEMTYRKVAPMTIAIDHTFVPPEHRGKGIAERLVGMAMADARAEGTKIIPVCSYVVAQLKQHPEWSDLIADEPPANAQI